MQEMLFECGLIYSKTFSERNGSQDISGHSDKCMENIQERESQNLGWGEEGDQEESLGSPRCCVALNARVRHTHKGIWNIV